MAVYDANLGRLERPFRFDVRLPDPPDTYTAKDQRELRRSIAQALSDIASRPPQARPFLYAVDYGAVGDGVTDDSDALQAAMDAGAEKNLVVYAGAQLNKITKGLTMSGPGLVYDNAPHGSAGGPGILVSGSGYTAVTVNASTIISNWNVTVYGTGNTANGVLFQNILLSSVLGHTRVYNLDGFHVKVNKCWDTVFGPISSEMGGNASEYAFSVNDDGDTTNESHFLRIQVEKSNKKAIYISGSTLDCVIDSIHSEQAVADPAYITWFLGGNRSLYNSIRLAATVPGDASAWFSGGQTQYNAPLTEGAIPVTLEGANGENITIISPEFQGTASVRSGNTGRINILGGKVHKLAGDASLQRIFGTYLETLEVGFANNDPWRAIYTECDIGSLTSNSTTSAGTFVGCRIIECNNLLRGYTKLVGCPKVASANTIAFSSGTLEAIGTTIEAALTYTNSAPIRLRGSSITGTVSCGDAGNVDLLCDGASTVGGASTGVGIPTGGTHVVGDRHFNPIPVAGNPKSWVCTTAGSPGTFTSEGNL